MNKTINVNSTEHVVEDWREVETVPASDPMRLQMQAAMYGDDQFELVPGEASFTSASYFRLHTDFQIKGKPDRFTIVESENGRYRARLK